MRLENNVHFFFSSSPGEKKPFRHEQNAHIMMLLDTRNTCHTLSGRLYNKRTRKHGTNEISSVTIVPG